jgi:hypothetical protein
MKKSRSFVMIMTIFFCCQVGYPQINSAHFQRSDFNNEGTGIENSFASESGLLDDNRNDNERNKNIVIAIFMVVAGFGISGIWTADIVGGKFSDQGSFFEWREGENMLWPHICAEYLTSAALITGGIGLLAVKEWALNVSFAALGALTYTAINSSGWVLAKKERMGYGVPMWISLTGAIVSFAVLLN